MSERHLGLANAGAEVASGKAEEKLIGFRPASGFACDGDIAVWSTDDCALAPHSMFASGTTMTSKKALKTRSRKGA